MIIGSSKDGEVENIENNQEKENLDRKMNGWFLTSRMWLWGISDWREWRKGLMKIKTSEETPIKIKDKPWGRKSNLST